MGCHFSPPPLVDKMAAGKDLVDKMAAGKDLVDKDLVGSHIAVDKRVAVDQRGVADIAVDKRVAVDQRGVAEKKIGLEKDSVVVVGIKWMVAAGSHHFPPLLKALSQGRPLENDKNYR